MNTQLYPVLQPLSEATGELLKPVRLYPNDYLFIRLDDEEKHFIVQAQAFRPAEPWDKDVREINGQRLVRANSGTSVGAAETWVKRIPERQEIKDSNGMYKLAATDFAVIVIHHVWPTDKIIFADEMVKAKYEFLLLRFLSQSHRSKMVAEFKIDGKVPEMPPDYIPHPDPSLRLADYQQVGLMAALEQDGFAYFMEMGTGKTPLTVNLINLEAKRKRDGKYPDRQGKMYLTLVICPRQVRTNWAKEFERFSVHPGKTVILDGGIIGRTQALLDGIRYEPDCLWSACIISQDSLEATWDSLSKVPWDKVVYDESHGMKFSGSKRFRTARNFRNHTSSRLVLTGTPVANTPFDLWTQMEFLDHGLSGFMQEKAFRRFHGRFAPSDGESPIQKLVGMKAVALIQERLSRIAFMLRTEEAGIKLPDLVYDIYETEMTTRQSSLYNQLAESLVAQIEEGIENKTLTATNALTMLLRLAQITSGHIRWDDNISPETMSVEVGKVEQIDAINPKIAALVEMIKDLKPKEKGLIWCCFIEDMRIISDTLTKLGINHCGYHNVINEKYRVASPEAAELKMNTDPDCLWFIGNPASAGTGLNFLGYDREAPDKFDTYVGWEIFFSCNWSLIQRDQAEKRAHRRGTRMPVRVTDLMIPGTIDEEIRGRLMSKRQTALELTDIREILVKIKESF